ncbi:MAG: Uma2 family endonuclease [Deltaproteobacteria bacterium]|nr:Uma2 family endonuclease [Deltaproteobacteria bacterium]
MVARREVTPDAEYADVLAAPEHMVAEIIDGALHLSPRPRRRHGKAYRRLWGALAPFDAPAGPDDPGGWVIELEPELHLPRVRDGKREPVVPDLAGWRAERMPETDPDTWKITITPDWVCEILSPSTHLVDRTKKLPLYAHNGVGHLWLVDPAARTIEVYSLEAARWVVAATVGGDERVRLPPFEAVEIDLARLWFTEPPEPTAEPEP